MTSLIPIKDQQIKDQQIISALRQAALMQREHKGITYEHGVDLVNLVAKWGDRLADALDKYSDAISAPSVP